MLNFIAISVVVAAELARFWQDQTGVQLLNGRQRTQMDQSGLVIGTVNEQSRV